MGRISAAIWKYSNDVGKNFYKFTVDASCRDDAGNYQSSSSDSLTDALLVAKVADLADTRIRELLAVAQ